MGVSGGQGEGLAAFQAAEVVFGEAVTLVRAAPSRSNADDSRGVPTEGLACASLGNRQAVGAARGRCASVVVWLQGAQWHDTGQCMDSTV